jgi:8-oxo-dGTP pyrophosphatase MutT (NUDIX family)
MALNFDPRSAPVLPPEAPLPPVSADRFGAEALAQRFAQPPIWTPDIEIERWQRAPQPKPASVLVPLVMRPEPTVLLTQRTDHLTQHAGQISFPGGRQDPEDPHPVATALREAHEEVGLHRDRIHVLGSMPTYTTGTGYVVTPVVGLIAPLAHEIERLSLNAQADEVAEIFEVPLHFLMDPRNHQRRGFDIGGTQLEYFAMPWLGPQGQEYFIWGATAAMLRNLYRFLAA